jgi:hypothetical protein
MIKDSTIVVFFSCTVTPTLISSYGKNALCYIGLCYVMSFKNTTQTLNNNYCTHIHNNYIWVNKYHLTTKLYICFK